MRYLDTLDHIKFMGGTAYTLYIVLLEHKNYKTNQCWPGYGLIMKYTGFSKTTIIAQLEKLQSLGYIKIQKRENMSNLITILPLPNMQKELEVTAWQLKQERKRKRLDRGVDLGRGTKNGLVEIRSGTDFEPPKNRGKGVQKFDDEVQIFEIRGTKFEPEHGLKNLSQEHGHGLASRTHTCDPGEQGPASQPSKVWKSSYSSQRQVAMPISQQWRPSQQTCELLKREIANLSDKEIEYERQSLIERAANLGEVSRDWDSNFIRWVRKGIEVTRRMRAQLQIGKNVPEKAPAVKAPEKEVVGSNAGSQKVESSGVYFDAAEIMAALEKDRRRDELFNQLGEAHRAELLAAKERQIRNSDLMGKWLGLSEYGRHSYLVDGVKDDLVANM